VVSDVGIYEDYCEASSVAVYIVAYVIHVHFDRYKGDQRPDVHVMPEGAIVPIFRSTRRFQHSGQLRSLTQFPLLPRYRYLEENAAIPSEAVLLYYLRMYWDFE
jgi:hypothetical protein